LTAPAAPVAAQVGTSSIASVPVRDVTQSGRRAPGRTRRRPSWNWTASGLCRKVVTLLRLGPSYPERTV